MLNRTLTTIGGNKALVLEPVILEYLGLDKNPQISISIEGGKLIICKADNKDSSLSDDSSVLSDKFKKSSTIRSFFNDGRLKIGDRVIYYQPVKEGKTTKSDQAIIAEIVGDANTTKQYLQSLGDKRLYSFSGLRYKLIQDYGVKDVHADWGHTLTLEWCMLDSMKPLSEL